MTSKRLRIVFWCSTVTILLCLIAMAGWQFDIVILRQLIPKAPQTTPLTALLIALYGLSLLSTSTPYRYPQRIALPLILLGMLISTWTFFEYFFDLPGRIEQILYSDKFLATNKYPGRPSPQTLTNSFLIGSALLLMQFKSTSLKPVYIIILAYLSLLISWTTLFGYSTNATSIYRLENAPLTGISPITTLGFLFLSIGIQATWPDRGIIGLLRSKHTGGLLAKLLMPFPIFLPLFLSFLLGILKSKGLIASGFGIEYLWAASSIVTSLLIVFFGIIINNRDSLKEKYIQELQEKEEEITQINADLHKSETRYAQLVNEVRDYAIVRLTTNGNIEVWTKGAERIHGYPEQEILGQHFSILYSSQDQKHQKPDKLLQKALTEGRSEDTGWRIRKDGTTYWANSVFTPLKDSKGKVIGFSKLTRDLTEVKEAREALKNADARFQIILESTPDAIVMVNESGSIEFANNQTVSLFGYTFGELKDKTVEMLIPNRFVKNHLSHREKYFKNPKNRMMGEGLELYGQKKNDDVFPVEISLSHIRMGDGSIHVAAAIRDITERKKVEVERAKHSRNIELAQHVAKLGYYEVDFENRICHASKNFCAMFGISERVFPIEVLRNLIHPEDLAWVTEKFNTCLAKKTNFAEEYREVNMKTNKVLFIHTHSYFIFSKTDEIIGLVGLKQDISTQKAIEQEIIDLNRSLEKKVAERTVALQESYANLEQIVENRTEQLRASNEELEAFSYSVSHDLRAPLRAITGFSNKLLNNHSLQIDKETQRIVNIIIKNTTHMGELIDDILAFSRLSRVDLSRNRIELKGLFVEAFNSLLALETPQRSVEIDIAPNIPIVYGDHNVLQQAITNLVSNALKYTRSKKNPFIQIGYFEKNGEKVFFVKDNGVGFDNRHSDKLFGVFQRLHKTSEFEGTGVGLAIVQRIIHRHGGKIWGEGEVNNGAVFYFTLPTDNP